MLENLTHHFTGMAATNTQVEEFINQFLTLPGQLNLGRETLTWCLDFYIVIYYIIIVLSHYLQEKYIFKQVCKYF